MSDDVMKAIVDALRASDNQLHDDHTGRTERLARTVLQAAVIAGMAPAAEVKRLHSWVRQASIALRAATTIGKRSCDDGDHMNYVNHDRLLREAEEAGWLAQAALEEKTR